MGNDACRQFQLDIYGEITNALQTARSEDMAPDQTVWRLQKALLDQLESRWREPDNGIWEMRGPPRHFTHSKVMAWVGFMCAAEAVDRSGCDERAFRWRSLAKEIHNEVCDRAYDSNRNSFVQYYGAPEPDGSLLLLPLVGFLPATDPRMLGTVRALEQRLLHNGFLYRYAHSRDLDPLPEGEGAFLPCSFWLADNYALQGRHEEAERLFERLLGVTNDVGLLAEEYDPIAERFLGNFPQAFSHVALIGTAHHLANAALRGSAGRAGTNAKSSR